MLLLLKFNHCNLKARLWDETNINCVMFGLYFTNKENFFKDENLSCSYWAESTIIHVAILPLPPFISFTFLFGESYFIKVLLIFCTNL